MASNIYKFLHWKYAEDRNCWDFVREFLIEIGGYPENVLPPKSGINPQDKKSMTKAAESVCLGLVDCDREEFSIACHFVGRTMWHVGVVYNNKIWHVGETTGVRMDSPRSFESQLTTVYKKWQG